MELAAEEAQRNPEVAAFIAELRHWREASGCSQKKLAGLVGYTPSYVSKVERGTVLASRAFAESADQHLHAGRALVRRWKEMHDALVELTADRPRHAGPPADDGARPVPGFDLVVEHEQAGLEYRDGSYRARIRRQLRNTGSRPVTQYLIRIAVDRYPDDARRSNEFYRANPLTWAEIGLAAECGGEPMDWRAEQDRDSYKEAWLLFENGDGRFPLYPGETSWLEYGYAIPAAKQGQRWEREIRLPTRRLSLTMTFPAEAEPAVWGSMTSVTADAAAFPTPIARQVKGDQVEFTWSADDPPLHARYQVEWKLWMPGEAGRPGAEPPALLGRMRPRAMSAGPAQPEDAAASGSLADPGRAVALLTSSVRRTPATAGVARVSGYVAPMADDPITPQLAAVRLALDRAEFPPDGPVRPLAELSGAVAETVRLRLASNYQRLSDTLPDLLDELHRGYESSSGQRRAVTAALLSQAYRSADGVAYKIGAHDLSARIVAMMLDAARQSGDEVVVATAAYVQGVLFFANNRPDVGREVLERAAERVTPGSDPGASAAYGALHMRAAVMAGRAGQLTAARDHLAEAAELGQLVVEGEYLGTEFGPSSVRIHEISMAVDVGDPDGALRAAELWDPPSDLPGERRSHFYIDLARARAMTGSAEETVTALFQARAVAPEHIQPHPQVREILAELLQRPGASAQLREFARWAHVPPLG
jgi:transcriptional regulator with XRE-family HTH domain